MHERESPPKNLHFFGIAEVFTAKEIKFFSLWTSFISTILFLSIYDLTDLDIYSYGYNFFIFAPVLFLLNMALAISGNPLSIVFNMYILSFISGVLPSKNIFDSITDGLAFILSLKVLMSVLKLPGHDT